MSAERIDLAACEDIDLGGWTVSPSTGRVSRPGHRAVRLEPRVMQVLVALARAEGCTQSRDGLIEQVWAGADVTDDAITRCVSRLRRLFRGSEVGIETLPRVGYRLMVAEAATAPRKAGWRGLAAPLAAVVGLLAAGLAVVTGLGLVARAPVEPQPGLPRPLTTMPGFEVHPSLSPPGGQVAFAWRGEADDNWDIYVQAVGSDGRLRITRDPARDLLPVFSPDGSRIVFVRQGEDGCSLLAAPAVGGPETRLGACGDGGVLDLDFEPDGQALVYTTAAHPDGPGRVFRLDLGTGEAGLFIAPEAVSVSDENIKVAANGRVALTRSPALGVEDAWVLERDGLVRVSDDGLKIHGLAWWPDGESLVVASNRGGDFALWRMFLDGRPPLALPGTAGADNPASSPAGRIVYEAWDTEAEIRRLDLASGETRSILPSTRFQWDGRPSPDGGSMAFVSDRSGAAEVWVVPMAGGVPRQLTAFGGPYTHTPRWSPDGRRIALAAPVDGNFDIYLVDAAGGAPMRLTDDPRQDFAPAWSPDGRWLYFGSDRTGAWEIWRMEPGGVPQQVTRAGGRAAQPVGDTLYYVKADRPGLWRMPAGGGEESVAIADLAPVDWNNWQAGTDGIYYIHRPEPSRPELVFQPHDGRPGVVLAALPRLLYKSGLWVAPDGAWALITEVEASEADLMLIDLD